MSEHKKPLINPLDEDYTPFEQNLILAWAQALLVEYLRTHPNCSVNEKINYFLEAVEGGLYIVPDFRNRFGS